MSLVAVFQIGSLGDTIVSLPTLLSLKEFLPDCSGYLLVSQFDSNLKVAPNQVFDMAWKPAHQMNYNGRAKGFQQLRSVSSLLLQLRYYRPRYCVYLMPARRTQKQVDRDKLFFKAGGVRELVGFRALAESEMPSNRLDVRGTESFQRFLRVWNGLAGEKFPDYSQTPLLHPGDPAREAVRKWLATHRRYRDRPLVAVCPYSNSSSKDFGPHTIEEILTGLENREKVEAILIGGTKDREKAAAVAAGSGSGLNACGVFSLSESAALLAMCSLVVSVDSGPMHLAGAMGVPCVVAYSRIGGQLSRWLPSGADHSILYRDVPCAGCNLTECSVPGHPCMEDITARQILAVAAGKLRGQSPRLDDARGTYLLNWQGSNHIVHA